MSNIDGYKDRLGSPIGITNIRGPHIIDRVTIEYATGDKDMCFTYISGPRYKESITISEDKISYRFTDFDNDSVESKWSYSSSSEWFESVFRDISSVCGELEDRELWPVMDVIPISFTFHYMSGDTFECYCYDERTLLIKIFEGVLKLIPQQEDTPKFMDYEMISE